MNIFLSTIFAFLITFLAIPLVIKISDVRQLFDVPNRRKSHTSKIPVLGGAAILVGVASSSIFFTSILEWYELKFILTAMFLIYLMGLVDDLKETSFFIKLLAQIVAALVIVLFGKIAITNFYGLFAVFEISPGLSVFISVALILLTINAYNFIDGIDGLSSIMAMIPSLFYGSYFLYLGLDYYAIFAFTLCGSLLAFLFFNFPPAKIFMGDAGSLVLGLILSILTIKFIETAETNSKLQMISAPAVAFGLIAIPLFDLLRVVILRLFKKKSPFKPDQLHIHHQLIIMNYSHKQVIILFAILSLILITLNLIADSLKIGVNYMMISNFILLTIFSVTIWKKKSRSSIENRP